HRPLHTFPTRRSSDLSSASGRYSVGVTVSRPLLRPRWCRSTIGAPSKLPPTRPPLARNSAITCAFQSSDELMDAHLPSKVITAEDRKSTRLNSSHVKI